MISELFSELFKKFKQVHRNIYAMGLVSLFIQLGATLVYITAETFTSAFMTEVSLFIMRSFSESMSTSVRIISGFISDYFNNKKLLLSISYGSMIVIKVVFLLCVILGNWIKSMPQSSKLICYVSYLFITAHIIDRIMGCIRDVPQAALMLDSIQQSNKYLLTGTSQESISNNIIFSLGIRKMIASLGSILGGIISYVILKYKLLSNTTVYALAIVPLIIGNIILYFGVQDIINSEEKTYDNEYTNVNENAEILNVVEIENETFLTKYTNLAINIITNNMNIFTIAYYIICGILSYKFQVNSKIMISILLIIYNLLFFSKNIFGASIFRILLLAVLFTTNNIGYGILAVLSFMVGLYLNNDIIELKNNFNIMQLMMINSNTLYYIVFSLFSILLIPSEYIYILFGLLSIHTIIYNYARQVHTLYVNISLLLLAQLKIWTLTQDIIKYILFVITSTLSVFHNNQYMFIIPMQLIELVKYISIANVPYIWMFNIAIIASNFMEYMISVPTGLVKFFIYRNRENNIISQLLSDVALGFQATTSIKTMYKYSTSSIILLVLFLILMVFALNFPFSILTKILIAICGSVILFGIFTYINDTYLKEYFIEYKNYLLNFGITVVILCFMHMGRSNDTFFFSHGYGRISGVTKVDVPLIFTFLYLIITITSFLLSYIKKYKLLLFILIGASLIATNVSLLWTTIPGFICTLTCLGIYSSGNEVLFLSMIKEVIPSTKANGTFLGIYYLCMSVATILNAVISVQLSTNSAMVISVLGNILNIRSLGNPLILNMIIFISFPIISMIIWLIYINFFQKNNND